MAAGPADQLDGEDGVAAQLEEIVGDADALQPQQLAPQGRQGALGLAARSHLGRRRCRLRLRQGLAVELAVGGQRQPLQHQDVGRNHVVRQRSLQPGAQPLSQKPLGQTAAGLVTDRHDIADQPLAGAAVPRHHRRLAHALLRPQPGLHLAQLDAEAADLHLMVDPPDILDHPVHPLAHEVAGAVEPAAVPGERIGHEALRRQARAVSGRPRARPDPPRYSSPTTPSGTGVRSPSRT